jgi:hypothetical protein
MVEEDAHVAVVAPRVAKRVLDRRNLARRRAREVVSAHGKADAVLDLDLVVFVDALLPALSTIDGEASILSVALLDSLAAHKVRHCLLGGWAELVLARLRWLEEDIGVAIGIELSGCIGRLGNIVAAILVHLADPDDGGRPLLLHLEHLVLCHRLGICLTTTQTENCTRCARRVLPA